MRKLILLALVLLFRPAAFAEGVDKPGDWDPKWSTSLLADLDQSGLYQHDESQIDALCSGYKTDIAKKQMFWHQLFASLSWKESSYGPGNWIKFKGGINMGLFQIDPRLRTYYGCKDFDLFDPYKNIECAVKMTIRLVERFGSFLTGSKGGMAAYWQPLRSTSKMNARNRKLILADVNAACHTEKLILHSTHGFDPMDEFTPNTVDDLQLDLFQLELPEY